MRDPNRIEPFMAEMGTLWQERFPDWRFGQLMYNFFYRLGDPFYYEEEELMVGFKAFCENEDPKKAIEKFREVNSKLNEEKKKSFMEMLEKFKGI